MKRINRINRYMAVFFANISLIIACEYMAKADDLVFTPPSPTETNDLSDIGDDDVDVRSGITPGTLLDVGDSITWHYAYGTCYVVRSNDRADIEELRLFGSAISGTTVKVELQFSDLNGHLIGTRYMFSGTWGVNNILVSNDNDILGNLQPLNCICDFELKTTVTAGQVNFTGADFLWEAGDIEACPEPMTMLLLGTGLAGVAIKTRKRLKSRKSKQRTQ